MALCTKYRLSNRQSVVMETQERRDVVEMFLYFKTARGPIWFESQTTNPSIAIRQYIDNVNQI